MSKEIILNGMNKAQLQEGIQAAEVLKEGFEMLVEQIDRITSGEEVPQSEIRKAKLKLNESIMIMNDLKQEQEKNSVLYTDANRNLNRSQRRSKKHGRK